MATPRSLELQHLTWPEVRDALAAGYTTVVLVGGALEQHGPHLPLGMDIAWGHALGTRVVARLGNALLAPVIPMGPDEEMMAFPGTISIDVETSTRVLACACESLLRHGFTQVVACTSHGGWFAPLAALPAALSPEAREKVVVFDDIFGLLGAFQPHGTADGIAIEEMGAHAGEFETSVALAIDPAMVHGPLPEGTRIDLAAQPDLFDSDISPHAPDGVVGDPRRSEAARGARYLDAIADLVAATARAHASAGGAR